MSDRSDMARLGRYELRGMLGQGGFATVYRAWDPALGREVALKALLPHLAGDPGMRERFLAEGRALAGLRHPNIVTVFDVGEAEGRPFFAMELIEGPTAAQWLSGGRVSPAQALPLLRGLASALDYLHAAGLIHRDIKPANVMLDASGRVVLMDFGIARSLDRTQLTATGASLGTPQYMAPEQVRGEPAGPAADIYALGVLTFQLLAGRAPFVGDTAYVLHAQAYEPPPPLQLLAPGLPEHVYAAIAGALQKDPRRRPQQAGAFVQMLEGTRTIPMPPPIEPPSNGARRTLLWVGGGAVAAALLVALLVVAALAGRGSASNTNTTALRVVGGTATGPTVAASGATPAATAAGPAVETPTVPPTPTPAATTPRADPPPSRSTGDVPAAVTSTPPPQPPPQLATSNLTLQNRDVWLLGRGALQACFEYRSATPGLSGVRARIVRAADRANPLVQSALVALNANAGQQCAALDSIGPVPAGDYVALLYDQDWNAGSSYAFPVNPPPPTPAPPPPPPTQAPPPAARTVSGDWTFNDHIRYGANAGQSFSFSIHLNQQGTQVTGTSSTLDLSGTLSGDTLHATYGQNGNRAGEFIWTFTADRTRFEGAFTNSAGNGGVSYGSRDGGPVSAADLATVNIVGPAVSNGQVHTSGSGNLTSGDVYICYTVNRQSHVRITGELTGQVALDRDDDGTGDCLGPYGALPQAALAGGRLAYDILMQDNGRTVAQASVSLPVSR